MSPDDPERAEAPLTAEQASAMLGVEVAKRRRVASVTRSGSRMITIGLLLGTGAMLGAWLGPAEGVLAWAPWVLGATGALAATFGALRLVAAWQLGRR